MNNTDDRVPELVIDADTVMTMVTDIVEDMIKVSQLLSDGEIIEDDIDDLDSLWPVG